MRLILTFAAETPGQGLLLPIHYNALVQGFLYRHLEAELARRLHEEGLPEGQRRLKLFTFSRLLGRYRLQGDQIQFEGPVRLVISSPMDDFLESLALHLVTASGLQLGEQRLELAEIGVEPRMDLRPPLRVKALSPITVYSTLYTATGGRKTYYYSPFEAEFESQLLQNLQRKARVWYREELPLERGSIRSVKVSSRNQHIVKYKGTVVKGWSGIYELALPPEYLFLAYYAGLGAKNSQGFGCVEVWQNRRAPEEEKLGSAQNVEPGRSSL